MKKVTATIASVCLLAGLATAGAAMNTFSDKDSFAEWFAPSVEKMHFNKIITGYEDGSFGPEKNVTRAELAVMLDRFANAIEKPLASGPTACTMQLVYGVTMYVQDNKGFPITDATFQIEGSDEEAPAGMNGYYAFLPEQEGYFTITVSKDGYREYTETIKLEKDACHVIPQARTVTLFEVPTDEVEVADEALPEDENATEEDETSTDEQETPNENDPIN